MSIKDYFDNIIEENIKLSISWLKESLFDSFKEPTMNNLTPKETGLDNYVWLQGQSNINDLQHSPYRIKVTDKSNPHPSNNMSYISFIKKIDDNDIISKLTMGKNSKRKLKRWMEINEELLRKYANREINYDEFKKLMHKV